MTTALEKLNKLNSTLRNKRNRLNSLGFYEDYSVMRVDDINRKTIEQFREEIEVDNMALAAIVETLNKILEKHPTAKITNMGDYDGITTFEVYVERKESDEEYNKTLDEYRHHRYNYWKSEYDKLMAEIQDLEIKIKEAEKKVQEESSEEVTQLHHLAKQYGYTITKNGV
jgi:hypothetical protein